ncbi:MAG: periplasmic heavy metal sensor [Elusimicrobia bacterium]|nr:periplasmic heavy metal sensor [Elusimicrobiota bacterium]
MKRIVGAGLALALVLGVGAKVLRAEGGEGRGGPGAFFKELTEEQRSQLKALRRAHREAVTPLRDKLEDELDALRVMVEKDTASEKDLAAAVERVKNLHRSMQSEREKAIDKAAAVLTAKQRARAVVAIAGRMRHAMMRFGGGRGPRGGPGKGPHGMDDEDDGPDFNPGE